MYYLYAFKILPTKNEYKEFKEYKINLEKQLPELKGKREDLWRKYHRATNENYRNIQNKERVNKLIKIDRNKKIRNR